MEMCGLWVKKKEAIKRKERELFFLFVFLCTKEAWPGDAGQTIRAPGEYVFKLLINAQKQEKSCSVRMRVRKQMGRTRNVLMEKLKKTKQKRILVFLFYTDVNRGNHLSQRRLSSCCGSFSNGIAKQFNIWAQPV